jgi:hypothetical protein
MLGCRLRISSLAVILGIVGYFPTGTALAAPPVVFCQIRSTEGPGDLPLAGSGRSALGGRICLLRADGSVSPLTPEFASALDPDVSFDGASVLFSGRRRKRDRWGVHEIRLDGSSAVRVVDLPEDCLGPIYLPDGRILFSAMISKGGRPEAALFACRPGGAELQRLTYHAGLDLEASLLADGRVLFTNWHWDTRERRWIGHLYTINTDGTGVAAVRRSERASEARQMPDGGLVLALSDPGSADGSGCLHTLSMRRIANPVPLANTGPGRWRSPCPLPDGDILSARLLEGPDATYGLWRRTASGVARVYDDPSWHDLDPMPALPRPVPMGHLSITDLTKTKGVLYCLDATFPEGGRKPVTLRVVAGPRRRIVGYAPVEADGSFAVEVPADLPLSLELLDREGASTHPPSQWVWVRPNETRGCSGCHEDRDLAPENRRPAALTRLPMPLARTLPNPSHGR